MGYCFSLGSGIVTWALCHQKTIAISTLEAEYISVSEASCKLLWITQLLQELHLPPCNIPIFLCDNNGAQYTANDPTNHSYAKHIDIWHHFVCKLITAKTLSLYCINSKDNISDILTKPLLPNSF